jgi:hypothetical protein
MFMWSLPFYMARAGMDLVGWWPMCGGFLEVAARLKLEAERQNYDLVGVLGQRK